ncbi:thioredoxin-disulfide reductase [Candidatus Amesbacteria bacterium]|nr:thioredoxin-disulfide reductase [Candidatus Amesbacteria bacterium]
MNDKKNYDVIIIGSGPAGLTAGIYTARANLKTLCIAGNIWGGQLMQTTLVENFPGFPDGIQGPDLMMNMRKQAEKMGVEFVDKNVEKVDVSKLTVGQYSARAIIVATGAEFKWLGLPSEQKLIGRGVSACATCDAAFFKDNKVVVVGGGDAAMEEALYLTKFVSSLIIVHRRDTFRASKIMQDRVLNNPKIKILFNTEVKEIFGEDKVTGVQLMTTNDNRMTTYDCSGVFVAIGHTPATKIFEGQIKLDAKGYALKEQETKGIFIAGDVHDHKYRQAITAAGYGCEAALDAERYLSENR